MFIKSAFILCALVVSGCTMPASLEEEERGKTVSCVDTRDKEEFVFNTDTVHDVRIGIGTGSSFKAVTDEGKVVYLSEKMEAWIKCEEVL